MLRPGTMAPCDRFDLVRHRQRLGQLDHQPAVRRLARRADREGHLRRHLPERRLHPHQDVRLPGRPGPDAHRVAAGSASTSSCGWCTGRRSGTGSSAGSTRSSGGRGALPGDQRQRHAVPERGALRRSPHPRSSTAARRSPADRFVIAAGSRVIVPDLPGLDSVRVPHLRHGDAARRAAAEHDHHRRRVRRGRVRARLLLLRYPGALWSTGATGCCARRTTTSPPASPNRSRATSTSNSGHESQRVEVGTRRIGHAAHRRPRGPAARADGRGAAGRDRTAPNGDTLDLAAAGVEVGENGSDRGRRAAADHGRAASSRWATSAPRTSSSTSPTTRPGWSSTTCCIPTP